MLGDEAPERAGIGRADGLALVQDRRAAGEQRRIDDVAVADHPTDVGRRPERVARAHAVNARHRPLERDGVAAVVAHDAFRDAGRSRRIEDVERIGRLDGHALDGGGARHEIAPLEVAALHERRRRLRALQDHTALGLVAREVDRPVEQRLVRDDPAGLDPARRGDDQLGSCIVDALGQLVGGEAAEHDGVDGPDARAGQHGHDRFGHHRHVDDHAVALRDALAAERARDPCDDIAQLGVGEHAHGVRDRTVVDERALLAAAAVDVQVERVVAGVEPAAGEPPIERWSAFVEDTIPAAIPVQVLGRPRPEAGGIDQGPAVRLLVNAFHRVPPKVGEVPRQIKRLLGQRHARCSFTHGRRDFYG